MATRGRQGVQGSQGIKGERGRQGETGPQGLQGEHWAMTPGARKAVMLLLFAMAVGFGTFAYEVHDQAAKIEYQAAENKQRIKDIQISRIESCRAIFVTMQAILRVAHAASTTPSSAELEMRYNRLLDLANPDKCVNLTTPK